VVGVPVKSLFASKLPVYSRRGQTDTYLGALNDGGLLSARPYIGDVVTGRLRLWVDTWTRPTIPRVDSQDDHFNNELGCRKETCPLDAPYYQLIFL